MTIMNRCPRCADLGYICHLDGVVTCPGELCARCDYVADDQEDA